jgi:hypothetical protein
MQELRSYVTPRRASSSYRFRVHSFIMHAPRWKVGPLRVYNTLLWAKNTEDEDCGRHNVNFQEKLESEEKLDSPLAYPSKYLEITLGSSFELTNHLCSKPNNDSAQRNWGQTWSRASTQFNISAKAFVGRLTEGELHYICRMEPVLVLPKNNHLCLIMPLFFCCFMQRTNWT